MRGQVRPGPAAKMAAANSAKKERQAEKKETAKSFLKGKADKVAGKTQANLTAKKEEGATKKVIEAKAPVKEKKEAVLAEARKKIGASEEKRAEFKERTKQSQAKRAQKREAAKKADAPAASTPATPAQTPGTTPAGRIRRADLDPSRSVMVQRVNQQMANTGATREEARGAVVARRDARQQQLEKIQSEQGVGQRQAQGIMKYGNKTAVAPEGGGSAVANYQLAKRVVQMANNKGLTRKEAAGVIASRKEKRQAAAAPAQTPTA